MGSPSPSYTIVCSMCGASFDPLAAAAQAACQACPLHPNQDGCTLVRCPSCGFETVNPQRTGLGRLFMKLFPNSIRSTTQ